AHGHFQHVVSLTGDGAAQAEAHFNAFQAALELRDWPAALAALRQAAALDPQRWMPFPLDKYEPQRILGAGGFGAAFLCGQRYMAEQVVVKALLTTDLDREISSVFAEAQVLRKLQHAAIVHLWDCGYADPAAQARPFLVMEYFDGPTLEEWIARNGPLA